MNEKHSKQSTTRHGQRETAFNNKIIIIPARTSSGVTRALIEVGGGGGVYLTVILRTRVVYELTELAIRHIRRE